MGKSINPKSIVMNGVNIEKSVEKLAKVKIPRAS